MAPQLRFFLSENEKFPDVEIYDNMKLSEFIQTILQNLVFGPSKHINKDLTKY